ncbi:hypothetical protein BaRGS_00039004 [Batillaria attramentaria]|uniref:Uncharacterized protein n=1 Tax=Batillaria attramentaria TaxID=370345 RepID=A0ABD0J4K5_9CAEN
MARDFLAARHMADMTPEDLNRNLQEHKILNHARFALTTSLLCGLVRHGSDTTVLGSLLQDLAIQVIKHSRKITFREEGVVNDVGRDGEEEENGVGSSIMNFAHTLQVLSECTTRPEMTGDLVKSLPKSINVQREGLMPLQCLYGLARAIKDEHSHIAHFEIDLLPHHNFQTHGLHSVAEALAGNPHLQTLVIRWQSLPLMVNFLRTCLLNAPHLQSVVLDDVSRKPVKQVNAVTWAGLQELCALLNNTRSLCFRDCQSVHVVSQLVLYIPNTIHSLDFSGSAFNSISAADLGAKLETSQHCSSLNLTDTHLESADLTALFHDLKLCTSIRDLSLASTRLDRACATALSEYIRLTTSLERLDLTSCHLTTESCQLLAAALRQNRSLVTIVLTDADVSEEGRMVLARTKEGEIAFIGLELEDYM